MEIFGTVIAASALGLTVWQGCLTRKHNRLSVTPHLDWHINTRWTPQGATFSFVLKNTGIGPAIIKSRTFHLDGKPFIPEGDQSKIIEQIAPQCFSGYNHSVAHASIPGIDTAILPSHEVCVAEIAFSGLAQSAEKEIKGIFGRVDLDIGYESFYRECFFFTTREQAGRMKKA